VGERDFESLKILFGSLIDEENNWEWSLETAVSHLQTVGLKKIQKAEPIGISGDLLAWLSKKPHSHSSIA